MKKIVCAMLVIQILYAWNGTTAFTATRKLFFETNVKEYYKAWAIGYCLGYYAIKDDREVESIPFVAATNKKAFNENLKIENIVYVGDIGALNELKTYIDEKRHWLNEDRINNCLGLLIPPHSNKNSGINDEIERIVKKYCKDCE